MFNIVAETTLLLAHDILNDKLKSVIEFDYYCEITPLELNEMFGTRCTYFIGNVWESFINAEESCSGLNIVEVVWTGVFMTQCYSLFIRLRVSYLRSAVNVH